MLKLANKAARNITASVNQSAVQSPFRRSVDRAQPVKCSLYKLEHLSSISESRVKTINVPQFTMYISKIHVNIMTHKNDISKEWSGDLSPCYPKQST